MVDQRKEQRTGEYINRILRITDKRYSYQNHPRSYLQASITTHIHKTIQAYLRGAHSLSVHLSFCGGTLHITCAPRRLFPQLEVMHNKLCSLVRFCRCTWWAKGAFIECFLYEKCLSHYPPPGWDEVSWLRFRSIPNTGSFPPPSVSQSFCPHAS